ncbi:MAG: glycosyltransferase family 4 protein [Fervidicoccaceae archaeon]
MRALVFHALFELAGGVEKFSMELCRALEELGHEVEIRTFVRDREALERSLSLLERGYEPRLRASPTPLLYNALDSILEERFVRLKRLILAEKFLRELEEERRGFDLVIDTGTNVPTDVDVSYIHYPTVAPGYGSGLLYDLYHELVVRLARRIEGSPRLILTNSSWTAEKVAALYPRARGRLGVLHPPVDVEYFAEAQRGGREKLIVTVSRFTPEKRLEDLLIAARELSGYDFVFVGSAGRYSRPVIERMRSAIEEWGLGNVELKINVDRRELREILGMARFYVHPPYSEHFGIAAVEAMAAGCVPIVYRGGGLWTDVVSGVDQRLGYIDVREIPRIVGELESDGEELRRLGSRAAEVSRKFSYDRFKLRLAEYLRMIESEPTRGSARASSRRA